MFEARALLFRSLATYGILCVGLGFLFTVGFKPFSHHIVTTQQYTSWVAKSRVLGYQTPDFSILAQGLLNNRVYTDHELDNYRAGMAYLSFFKKGSELFPDLFEMHYMEGICEFWMGDIISAEASLRRSLELNPVFFWSYYNLGLLYLKNGQMDGAIALLLRAKQIPVPLTVKILSQQQAFEVVWRFMPDPPDYIQSRLQLASQQIDYLLLVAMAIKKNNPIDVHFDPNQWQPVFF